MAIELPDSRSESDDVLEALRQRAVHARELGYPVVDIAAILGVREETVSRWCVKYEQGGQEALPGERTGRPPVLAGSGSTWFVPGSAHELGVRAGTAVEVDGELARIVEARTDRPPGPGD